MPLRVTAARACASWPAPEGSSGGHRRRPGMPGRACERQREGAGADDPGDDADVDALSLEHRSLLDVQLEVAGERRGVAPGIREPRLLEAGARETGDERFAT